MFIRPPTDARYRRWLFRLLPQLGPVISLNVGSTPEWVNPPIGWSCAGDFLPTIPGPEKTSGKALQAVREPGHRLRVAVVDAAVRGREQFEVNALVGDADAGQSGPERLGAQIQEPLVAGAGVDPDGTLRAQGVRVPVD